MAYFPFITDIEDMDCLIVGGGNIALHKVKILAEYNVNIHIITISACDALTEIARNNKRIDIRLGRFADGDIDGMDFVVVAAGDKELGLYIARMCKECKIPVNVVDIKEACSFIFPAIIHKEPVLAAVSSGGSSPALAADIKKSIEKVIPDYYAGLACNLESAREYVIKNTDNAITRKKVFEKLVLYGKEHNGEVPEDIVKEIIRICREDSLLL